MGDTLFVPAVVSQLAFNPLCMMRYIDGSRPPDEWENVCAQFCKHSEYNTPPPPNKGIHEFFWQ